jgi:1,4-alpha-glucan branching enzyme
MAQEGGQIGSYRQYIENILPRIKEAGYTAIQLMAV